MCRTKWYDSEAQVSGLVSHIWLLLQMCKYVYICLLKSVLVHKTVCLQCVKLVGVCLQTSASAPLICVCACLDECTAVSPPSFRSWHCVHKTLCTYSTRVHVFWPRMCKRPCGGNANPSTYELNGFEGPCVSSLFLFSIVVTLNTDTIYCSRVVKKPLISDQSLTSTLLCLSLSMKACYSWQQLH